MQLTAILLALVFLSAVTCSTFAEEEAQGLRELTQEELDRYQFDVEESDVLVKELTLGQRYVLDTQRREISDLVARRLGILNLKEKEADIPVLQWLVDKKAIQQGDVREWQGLGIIFGDILVAEFGMHWVSYEDDVGTSKALRWRQTDNYVFPVTLFSKRIQFNEKIDVAAVYSKIGADINRFVAYEKNRPEFK